MSTLTRSVLTARLQTKATRTRPAVYMVFDGAGHPVGVLEKGRNTPSMTHPWKAYIYSPLRSGSTPHYLAAYYDLRPGWTVPETANLGGKAAALAAIDRRLTR